MLHGAAAANAKKAAFGCHPLMALAVPGSGMPFKVVFLAAGDFNIHHFAKERTLNEDNLAICMGKALALKIDRFNVKRVQVLRQGNVSSVRHPKGWWFGQSNPSVFAAPNPVRPDKPVLSTHPVLI